MKEYIVRFEETYTYQKVICIEDNEDIEDVIHELEPVYAMTQAEFEELGADVKNDYVIREI